MFCTTIAGQPATFLWHESENLENCDAIVVPGGFAYGDYLRTGAIARFSPVMQSVKKFAAGGRPGAGHLQWFPDFVRERYAAGCAAEKCRPALYLQAGLCADGDRQQPVYPGAYPGPGVEDSDRAHGGKLLLRARTPWRNWSAATGLRSVTAPSRGRLPPPPTPMAPLVALPEY